MFVRVDVLALVLASVMRAGTLSPLLVLSAVLHVAAHPHAPRNLTSPYPRAPSFTHVDSLDRRDGWETAPTSGLDNYSPMPSTEDASSALQSAHALRTRAGKHRAHSIDGAIQHVVDAALKGVGKTVQVIITWYTGKDLQNPSCWHNSVWTPTDNSFACAVTLEGWTNRPKCFQFLELCNGSKKCIFVRVVDTCAGCAKGSKHVDLTKAAFQALASLDKGKLQVKMRLATDPKEWHENLWGPRHV